MSRKIKPGNEGRPSRAGDVAIAEYNRAYVVANRARLRADKKIKNLENAEQRRAAGWEYTRLHPGQSTVRYHNNIEAGRAQALRWYYSETGRAYREKNAGKIAETRKAHRMLQTKAMPKWADRKAIAAIYDTAIGMTELSGILYHVDHIYPLNHKKFNGLHVPWNLQVIPGSDNCSKGNRVPDAMFLGIR